jgi:hypothetical protein
MDRLFISHLSRFFYLYLYIMLSVKPDRPMDSPGSDPAGPNAEHSDGHNNGHRTRFRTIRRTACRTVPSCKHHINGKNLSSKNSGDIGHMKRTATWQPIYCTHIFRCCSTTEPRFISFRIVVYGCVHARVHAVRMPADRPMNEALKCQLDFSTWLILLARDRFVVPR